MNDKFITILQRLIKEQGKEVLLDHPKCKAFLAGYVLNDYKTEMRLFTLALESGAVNAISEAEELKTCKIHYIKALQKDYFLTVEAAEDIVNILALVLRGDMTKTVVRPQSSDPEPQIAEPKKKAVDIDYLESIGVHATILKHYKGPGGDVVLPEGITSIGKEAFKDRKDLISITLSSSISRIGDDAFWGCSNLTSITLPPSLSRIGNGVFGGCKSLTSIVLPSALSTIGDWVFNGCTSLTSITLPSALSTIGNNAFWGCISLTNITLPSSVSRIGVNAFFNCSRLTSIAFPSSVSHIGHEAFKHCEDLKNVTLSRRTSVDPNAFPKDTKLTFIN